MIFACPIFVHADTKGSLVYVVVAITEERPRASRDAISGDGNVGQDLRSENVLVDIERIQRDF